MQSEATGPAPPELSGCTSSKERSVQRADTATVGCSTIPMLRKRFFIQHPQIILLTSGASRVHTGWYVVGAEEAATEGGKAARS
jgi:hypothetical protein